MAYPPHYLSIGSTNTKVAAVNGSGKVTIKGTVSSVYYYDP